MTSGKLGLGLCILVDARNILNQFLLHPDLAIRDNHDTLVSLVKIAEQEMPRFRS